MGLHRLNPPTSKDNHSEAKDHHDQAQPTACAASKDHPVLAQHSQTEDPDHSFAVKVHHVLARPMDSTEAQDQHMLDQVPLSQTADQVQ